MNINIIIDPIKSTSGEITRYDIYAEGVQGAYLGYAKSLSQAEAIKDGIVRLMNAVEKKVLYEMKHAKTVI